MRNISIHFCIVSTVKNFRLKQQSVRDNENVVIHRAYWWKQFLWMKEWMLTVGNHCFEKTIFRMQASKAHAQHSWRPVLHIHGNGVLRMMAFICTTYKNTKPVTMESCQPCTILWMAADTATNVYEILFTHKVQCIENGISNTSIHTLWHSKLHIKWCISFYYNINHTDATWWYP